MHNRQKRLTASHKLALVLPSVLIIFILLAFINQDTWVDPAIHNPSGTVGYQEDFWVLEKDDQIIREQLKLPDYMPLENAQLYSLKTQLTYNGSSDESPYAFLHVSHLFCRVLIDGQEVFRFMPEDVHRIDKAKSPGFIYKAIPLPQDYLGKEIEIQLLPPLGSDISYGLPDIVFGDYSSSIRSAIKRDAPHDLMMILCAVIGLTAILFSAFSLHGSEYREGISIGVFCLLFALYMVTECRINVFYIGNPYGLYILNYITLSLLPVSLMCFMRERLPERFKKLWTTIILVTISLFLLELILHFTGVCDMREVVTIIHCTAFIEVALVIALMLTMKDRTRKIYLLVQSICLIIGMLADILIYRYHWKIGSNDATFTIMGVLVFLIIEVFHIWKTSLGIYAASVRSNLYWQMAYVDELTEVGNRRAYDDEINKITSGSKTYTSMIVVSADLNKLKYVNDHFGHSAGDNLIAGAARILKTAVGNAGLVFRTGGDEFAIFLYDVEIPQYEQAREAALRKIDLFNHANPYTLSMAVGYVQIHDNQVLKAMQEADQKMYEEKTRRHFSRE